jgi:hypothetical protein
MTKQQAKPKRAGRPRSDKTGIYSRMSEALIARLDAVGAAMVPQPTRAQLIELAVSEFCDRRGKVK